MVRPHHHTQWYDPPEALHYEYWIDQNGNGRARWDRAKDRLPPETAHFQAWRSALDEPWHSSPWVGDRTIEMINLFDDPSRSPIRKEHRDMLRQRPDDMIPAAPRIGWH